MESNPYKTRLNEFPSIIKSWQMVLEQQDESYIETLAPSFSQLIVEIGSGSGNHLLTLASQNPKAKVVGFERRYKRVVRTAEKAKKQSLNNLFVLQYDGNLFHTLVKENSVHQFYLNFPDPWMKRKYRKKRLFLGDFIERIHQNLALEGFFSFKTDHLEYFESFLKMLQEYLQSSKNQFCPLRLEEVTVDLYQSPWIVENIQTEFETLFIYKLKKKIKHFKVIKSAP